MYSNVAALQGRAFTSKSSGTLEGRYSPIEHCHRCAGRCAECQNLVPALDYATSRAFHSKML